LAATQDLTFPTTGTAAAAQSPTFAVLFKVHFWDEFAARQIERLRSVAGRGDIYVVMDETMQPGPEVPGEQVLRIRTEDLTGLGLALYTTHGSVIWYNSDYPNYVALRRLPHYDYYAAVEYDAVLFHSLDDIIDRMAAESADYVGFELRTPDEEWPWTETHRAIYGDSMEKYMSSVSFYSHRGLERLLTRRQEIGIEFAEGKLPCWPMLEVFVPAELRRANLNIAELRDYTDTENFNWWPPTEEAALPDMAQGAFYHPVLHGTRFVRSMLHHEPSVMNLLLPNSATRRRLSGWDRALVRRMVWTELVRRVRDRWQRELERRGLRPAWYADVLQGSHQSRQRPSAHNAA
jgi:hypothetical protein